MPSRAFGVAWRAARAAAWTAAVAVGVAAPVVRADEAAVLPAGLSLGPVVLAPSLTAGYLYNSNLYLQSSSQQPQSDSLATLQPAIVLTVPFSSSTFRLTDTLLWKDYGQTAQTNGRTSNDAVAELDLVFGSRDTLTARVHDVAGVAETAAFDPGGEVVFRGESFSFHNEAIELARDVKGARGYKLSLQRNALHFDEQQSSFFNYRGYDGEAAYVQPLNASLSAGFGYIGSRYDHYDTAPGADPYEVFRHESGDTGYLQVQGWLSPRQPYHLRLGWERLRFDKGPVTEYRGLVWVGDISFVMGGGIALQVNAVRQPYRSFFGREPDGSVDNDYYVYHEISMRLHRQFQRGSDFGATVDLSQAHYPVAVFANDDLGDVKRTDRTGLFELYGNLAVRERVAFRLALQRSRRYSNFPGSDYLGTQIFGGFVFGWM